MSQAAFWAQGRYFWKKNSTEEQEQTEKLKNNIIYCCRNLRAINFYLLAYQPVSEWRIFYLNFKFITKTKNFNLKLMAWEKNIPFLRAKRLFLSLSHAYHINMYIHTQIRTVKEKTPPGKDDHTVIRRRSNTIHKKGRPPKPVKIFAKNTYNSKRMFLQREKFLRP